MTTNDKVEEIRALVAAAVESSVGRREPAEIAFRCWKSSQSSWTLWSYAKRSSTVSEWKRAKFLRANAPAWSGFSSAVSAAISS